MCICCAYVAPQNLRSTAYFYATTNTHTHLLGNRSLAHHNGDVCITGRSHTSKHAHTLPCTDAHIRIFPHATTPSRKYTASFSWSCVYAKRASILCECCCELSFFGNVMQKKARFDALAHPPRSRTVRATVIYEHFYRKTHKHTHTYTRADRPRVASLVLVYRSFCLVLPAGIFAHQNERVQNVNHM